MQQISEGVAVPQSAVGPNNVGAATRLDSGGRAAHLQVVPGNVGMNATMIPEGSLDGINYTTQAMVDASSGAVITQITAVGRYYLQPGSIPPFFRLRCSAYVAGNPTALMVHSNSRGE